MKRFYELYPNAENLPQPVADSSVSNLPQAVADSEQLVFCIPWGHNRTIIDKCRDNPAKALFFVKETIENNWSRAVLLNFLDTDLYERKGKAITNFSKVLPAVQSDLAQEMTNLSFYVLCFELYTLTSHHYTKHHANDEMSHVELCRTV